MFERLFKVIQAAFNNLLGRVEDPAIMLEQTYQDLNNQIVQLEAAVDQAIATEKQLEETLSTSKDQAAVDLEIQLTQQREATSKLCKRLTELKNELQKALTKKQMLIARDKAARATMKASEILGGDRDWDELETAIEKNGNDTSSADEQSETLGKLTAQLAFALAWAAVNISFLFLLSYFVHLPGLVEILVIPATAFFLVWTWWRQNTWFFRNAENLWHEMSKDMRNLKSKRKG